jgi:hypothetical protein
VTEIYITIAVEDALSEVVARKILEQTANNYEVINCLCRGGYGYLRKKINGFNRAANGCNFFVLTDQDDLNSCPPEKIASWLEQECHPNLIFRVAVMEVESWVLAHREAFAEFLSVPIARIPGDTDTIADPKQFLVNLARRSRSTRLRDALIPAAGSTSQQGPDYNSRLVDFIIRYWDVNVARAHSNSLDRAYRRLVDFVPICQ